MFINKMGSYHAEYGLNNQDFGFEFHNFHCIVDGCSEGTHSEVGAKLFVKKFLEFIESRFLNNISFIPRDIEIAFLNVKDRVTRSDRDYDEYLQDMKDYMCFTIMVLQELDDSWELYICGDGVVITQDHSGNVTLVPINHSSTPMYLAYSFIERDRLGLSSDADLGIKKIVYSKQDYDAIGIASDGIIKIIGTDHEKEFKMLIKTRKEWNIRRRINQLNNNYRGGFFKDDITIAIGGDKT